MPCLPIVLAAVMLAPPSGRPPEGPLARTEPRGYDVTFEVSLATDLPINAGLREVFQLADTPIVMPVIFQSTYSRVDPTSISAAIWFDGLEDKSLPARFRFDTGYPFGTQLAVLPIVRYSGQNFRWQTKYTVRVYSSRIDDAAAARITWPREWPQEVQDGLQPQMFIESDLPVFAETVARVSEGSLRLVPPYLAAKDLVRHCTSNIQTVGNGMHHGELRLLHGLEMHGAAETVRLGRGSPHDLVSVCVAMLCAAGIPARPVVGIEKSPRSATIFTSWAEFYLPGAGWIPFDPVALRGKGIHTKDVRLPWPEFGTMKDLNRRIPLAFHYIPPATVQSPQNPAVWGWDPRPSAPRTTEQFITLGMASRGRVKIDPGDPAQR